MTARTEAAANGPRALGIALGVSGCKAGQSGSHRHCRALPRWQEGPSERGWAGWSQPSGLAQSHGPPDERPRMMDVLDRCVPLTSSQELLRGEEEVQEEKHLNKAATYRGTTRSTERMMRLGNPGKLATRTISRLKVRHPLSEKSLHSSY